MSAPACRLCGEPLGRTFVDLGDSPLANSYVKPEDLHAEERRFPLKVYVCESCLLVQLPESESPEEIFSDYAYFSSFSESWVEHARRYAELMTDRLGLDGGSRVVELASNDGYLLQFFQQRGIPVLGIEPAANVAAAAEKIGVPTRVDFFGTRLAETLAGEGLAADLLLGNNVLAHVPDLNDFVAGMKILLAPGGVITMEFPHLAKLIERNEFDTIYHEHFSYFSFGTARRAFARHGLEVFDVDELPTHGGSLRVYAAHAGSGRTATDATRRLAAAESERGLDTLAGHLGFQPRVESTRSKLLEFLRARRSEGAAIAAYGAPAKGNTLLNYCGIGPDLVEYTVDLNPEKQGRYLPGSRLPIHAPERIAETRPDYVFILPWNLEEEIVHQMRGIREWGGKFFVAIPEVRVI